MVRWLVKTERGAAIGNRPQPKEASPHRKRLKAGSAPFNRRHDKHFETSSSMILLSHPTGNEFVREAIRALLDDAGLLSEFWTSVCWNQQHWLNRVLPRSVSRELGRRAFSHIGRDQMHCHPWVEVGRLAAQKLNLSRLLRHEVGRFSVDAVYRSLDSRVAGRLYDAPNIRGVYAYEDGALASFRVARQLGIKTIYELPIGYWRYYRELMEEEESLQPEWAVNVWIGR